MASFDISFSITMEHEGGYANNPGDYGGETYKGISRKYHPHWQGWELVDEIKRLVGTNPRLIDESAEKEQVLQIMVKDFYRSKYWNMFKGDSIMSQAVANELFDISVNLGIGRACKFLQRTLNILNRNGELWPDILEDGDVGVKTLGAVRSALAKRGEKLLTKCLDTLQGYHYLEQMKEDSTQEKWAVAWLSRLR